MFVRIKKVRITPRGARGLSVSIPSFLLADLGLTAGDPLSLYRGIMDGQDVLVLANTDSARLGDDTSLQARELAEAMKKPR